MRKLLVGVLGIALLASTSMADVKQGSVPVKLIAPEIIDLEVLTDAVVLVPGPEDYAATPPEILDCNNSCQALAVYVPNDATDNPVAPSSNNNNEGFIDRADAISLNIFTNANQGADLSVYGVQPTTLDARGHLTGVLRLEDIYLTVMCERTYISFNGLEGAKANVITSAFDNAPAGSSSNDKPANGICAANFKPIQANDNDKVKACATWLRLHNEGQHIFEVNEATKAKRLIVFKLGVGNLARYTTGEYNATIWFSLMPSV